MAAPLLQFSDMTYLGAFRVPAAEDGPARKRFEFGGFGLAYNQATDSLYLGGDINGQFVAEISIPAAVDSATLGDLNTATYVQNFYDPFEGNRKATNPSTPNDVNLGDMLVYQGKLYLNSYSYYDAQGTASTSHFSRPLDLSSTGSLTGPVKVSNFYPGLVAGHMAELPSEHHAAIGKPAITGNWGLAITSLQSQGPSAHAFDPEDIGVQSPVSTNPLVYYPYSNGTNDGPHGSCWGCTNVYYNGVTKCDGVFVPAGYRSVVFVGSHGTGTFCYGTGAACGDPADSGQGAHAWPYRNQMWLYDIEDLVRVKNGEVAPNSINPYATTATGQRTYEAGGKLEFGGCTFDQVNRKLYVSQKGGDSDRPVIHVWSIPQGQGSGGTGPVSDTRVYAKGPIHPDNVLSVSTIPRLTLNAGGTHDVTQYIKDVSGLRTGSELIPEPSSFSYDSTVGVEKLTGQGPAATEGPFKIWVYY